LPEDDFSSFINAGWQIITLDKLDLSTFPQLF